MSGWGPRGVWVGSEWDRVGTAPAPTLPRAKANEPAKAPPSLRPIPMELGDSLRDVGDPELRAVLESLARSLGDKEQDKT